MGKKGRSTYDPDAPHHLEKQPSNVIEVSSVSSAGMTTVATTYSPYVLQCSDREDNICP